VQDYSTNLQQETIPVKKMDKKVDELQEQECGGEEAWETESKRRHQAED
jgi:hypothetical protein